MTRTCPELVIMTFSPLKSRWTSWAAWAADSPRPAATKTSRISRHDRGAAFSQ